MISFTAGSIAGALESSSIASEVSKPFSTYAKTPSRRLCDHVSKMCLRRPSILGEEAWDEQLRQEMREEVKVADDCEAMRVFEWNSETK